MINSDNVTDQNYKEELEKAIIQEFNKVSEDEQKRFIQFLELYGEFKQLNEIEIR